MKIKKGDNVIMLSGKDRGKTGAVMRTDPKTSRVIVGGLNMIKRHKRATKQGQKGQIVSVERYVSASAVAVINKDTGKPARVGWDVAGDSKTRVDRKTRMAL